MKNERKCFSNPVTQLLILIVMLVSTAVSHAVEERSVSVAVQGDCSLEVQARDAFGELYFNYWDKDFIKLSELEIPGIEIRESSFSVPALVSAIYAGFAPISAIVPVHFVDLPPTAENRDDIVKLVPPASLQKELTTCLQKLPCPCSTTDITAVDLRSIELSSSIQGESKRLQCSMDVHYENGDSKDIRLQRGTDSEISRVIYSCRIGQYEVEHLLKSWDDACRRELNEFLEANKVALWRNSKDKTFCPVE